MGVRNIGMPVQLSVNKRSPLVAYQKISRALRYRYFIAIGDFLSVGRTCRDPLCTSVERSCVPSAVMVTQRASRGRLRTSASLRAQLPTAADIGQ